MEYIGGKSEARGRKNLIKLNKNERERERERERDRQTERDNKFTHFWVPTSANYASLK